MRLGDRVDGHLVSGHVDGVGQVESMTKIAESYKLVIRAPLKLSPYLAYKGSVGSTVCRLPSTKSKTRPWGRSSASISFLTPLK